MLCFLLSLWCLAPFGSSSLTVWEKFLEGSHRSCVLLLIKDGEVNQTYSCQTNNLVLILEAFSLVKLKHTV